MPDPSAPFVIGGLPLHPLVVHLVVVLLPLGAAGLILVVAIPGLRRRYAGLAVAVLAVGTLAAFVAKESGEALAQSVGRPHAHAAYAAVLVPVAAALLVAGNLWNLLQRSGDRAEEGGGSRLVRGIAGTVSALLAVAVIVLTVLVGHSGATAVWG